MKNEINLKTWTNAFMYTNYYETYSLRLFCYFGSASQIFHSKRTPKALNTEMNKKKSQPLNLIRSLSSFISLQLNHLVIWINFFVSFDFLLLLFLPFKIRINFVHRVWNWVFALFWLCVMCNVNLSIETMIKCLLRLHRLMLRIIIWTNRSVIQSF